MTLDFSPQKQTLSEDIQSLVDDLAATAASWVPELFPYGTKQSRDWRLGSLEGEKGGSTSIRLYGDKAGCFIDHANDCAKGGPLELIKVAYGCDFKTAILKAQDILRKPRPITKAALDDKIILARDNQKVHKLWKLCVQTERVIVEEYFAKRGIDLSLFGDVEDAAVLLHYPSQRFFPAVVAAIRGPLGGMVAVHRT